jgi:uncharacterized protein with PIN domain
MGASESDAPVTPRFYCDVMLGRLARELRQFGLDVKYNRMKGGLAAYKEARADDRVFLTRNSKTRSLPGAFHVESQLASEQLKQVRARFGSGAAPVAPAAPTPRPGTRCLEDNEPLQKISRDAARPAIPFYIYQIHHDFQRCPKCGRVYWPGSHVQNMVARLSAADSRKPEPEPDDTETASAEARAATPKSEPAHGRRPRRRFFRRGPRRRPGTPTEQQ